MAQNSFRTGPVAITGASGHRGAAARTDPLPLWVCGEPVAAAAVVFDCDGTLVDTEPLAWDAWRHVLNPAGVQVTDDDIRACTGTSFDHTYRHFSSRGRLPAPDDLRRAHDDFLLGRIADQAAPFADAVAACTWLARQHIAMAVASSSPRHRLELTLQTAGLSSYPHAVVARDDVERGKPHPDLFLAAAARLGIDPLACVAVEDAGPGAEAAQRAGMTVLAVWRGDGPTPAALTRANLIADCIGIPNCLCRQSGAQDRWG